MGRKRKLSSASVGSSRSGVHRNSRLTVTNSVVLPTTLKRPPIEWAVEGDEGGCIHHAINSVQDGLLTTEELDAQIPALRAQFLRRNQPDYGAGTPGVSWHVSCVVHALRDKYNGEMMFTKIPLSLPIHKLFESFFQQRIKILAMGDLNHKYFDLPSDGNWRHMVCLDFAEDKVYCKVNATGDVSVEHMSIREWFLQPGPQGPYVQIMRIYWIGKVQWPVNSQRPSTAIILHRNPGRKILSGLKTGEIRSKIIKNGWYGLCFVGENHIRGEILINGNVQLTREQMSLPEYVEKHRLSESEIDNLNYSVYYMHNIELGVRSRFPFYRTPGAQTMVKI